MRIAEKQFYVGVVFIVSSVLMLVICHLKVVAQHFEPDLLPALRSLVYVLVTTGLVLAGREISSGFREIVKMFVRHDR